jgi:hypothetical protein
VTTDTAAPPRYNPEVVERAVLEEVLYLDPQHLTREELVRKMTVRPDEPGRGDDVAVASEISNARACCVTTPEPSCRHTQPPASPSCSSFPDCYDGTCQGEAWPPRDLSGGGGLGCDHGVKGVATALR